MPVISLCSIPSYGRTPIIFNRFQTLDSKLKSEKWNDRYGGKRVVMWANTNANMPKPQDASTAGTSERERSGCSYMVGFEPMNSGMEQ